MPGRAGLPGRYRAISARRGDLFDIAPPGRYMVLVVPKMGFGRVGKNSKSHPRVLKKISFWDDDDDEDDDKE